MKKILAILFLLIFCPLVRADFSLIHKDKNLVILKDHDVMKFSVSDLNNFVSNIKEQIIKIKEKTPSKFFTKILSHRLVVILEKETIKDALFYPPGAYPKILSTQFIRKGDLILSISPALVASAHLNALFSHEFFHALHFLVNPGEEEWIREGLAMLFEKKMGENFNAQAIEASLHSSTTPLISLYDINDYSFEQYGHHMLYFHYLTQNCGKDLFWKMVAKKPKSLFGSSGIDYVLKKSENLKRPNLCHDFETTALNFEVARMHNHYSGASQSSNYFLIFSKRRQLPNTKLQSLLTQMPKKKRLEFFKDLPLYLPLLFEVDLLAKVQKELLIDQKFGLKGYLLEKNFPYDVLEVDKDLILKKEDKKRYQLLILKSALKLHE